MGSHRPFPKMIQERFILMPNLEFAVVEQPDPRDGLDAVDYVSLPDQSHQGQMADPSTILPGPC
jgi:hypothetical protein